MARHSRDARLHRRVVSDGALHGLVGAMVRDETAANVHDRPAPDLRPGEPRTSHRARCSTRGQSRPREGNTKGVVGAVVCTLVPQAIAAFLLAKVGASGAPVALHLTAAIVTLALAAVYGMLIGRLPDIARVFQHNAVLLRAIASHDTDALLTTATLRKQASFHPLASGVFDEEKEDSAR